jgi:hypothetical protein
LLRRQICGRADYDSLLRQTLILGAANVPVDQAEIEELRDIGHSTPLADDDVDRFDVAMDQAYGVSFVQRSAQLTQKVYRTTRWKRSVSPDQLLQRRPVHVAAREAAVIVMGGNARPAFVGLALDERLARLALGV